MFGLGASIHVARLQGSTIVLDITGDRYTRLPTDEADIVARLGIGERIPARHPALATLINRGVLVENGRAIAELGLAPARASALEAGPDADAGHLGIADLVAWRLRWRTRPMHRLLAGLPAERGGISGPVSTTAETLARRFERARSLLPLPRRCLPDACALVALCRRHGFATRLVIGVRDHPFAAHAWATDGDVVLSDPLDLVRELSPILVL